MALLDWAYFPIVAKVKGSHLTQFAFRPCFADDEVSKLFFRRDLRIGRSE